MIAERCSATAYGGGFSRHRCSRKPWKDGFCKQHHPDTVAARNKAREEKWDREQQERQEARKKEQAIKAHADKCVAACEGLNPEGYAECFGALQQCYVTVCEGTRILPESMLADQIRAALAKATGRR